MTDGTSTAPEKPVLLPQQAARRKRFVRAIIVEFGIAVVCGLIGAILGALKVSESVTTSLFVVAYLAAFAGILTLLYSLWHGILVLPNDKPVEPKKSASSTSDSSEPASE